MPGIDLAGFLFLWELSHSLEKSLKSENSDEISVLEEVESGIFLAEKVLGEKKERNLKG